MRSELDETKIEHIIQIDIPGALSNKTNFTAELIRLIRKSGLSNKAKLRQSFPEEVEAVERWEAINSRYVDPNMPAVGTVVIARKAFSNVSEGMPGVIYEQYDRSRYDDEGGTGVSIIFKSGFYCGYSMSELDSFAIEVTDKRIPALENYAFINVFRLRDDFMDSKFYEAFKSE